MKRVGVKRIRGKGCRVNQNQLKNDQSTYIAETQIRDRNIIIWKFLDQRKQKEENTYIKEIRKETCFGRECKHIKQNT